MNTKLRKGFTTEFGKTTTGEIRGIVTDFRNPNNVELNPNRALLSALDYKGGPIDFNAVNLPMPHTSSFIGGAD